MLNKTIAQAISEQITAEYYSAYLYLSMSAYCDRTGFQGFANWMNIQAQEELAHGTHLYNHMLERGAQPQFGEIKAPTQEFGSLTDVFTQSLGHERHITESINKIATIAMQQDDHATYTFLQWYVSEQVEEEASAELVLQKLTSIDGNVSMLYMLDSEMAARVFVDPFEKNQ